MAAAEGGREGGRAQVTRALVGCRLGLGLCSRWVRATRVPRAGPAVERPLWSGNSLGRVTRQLATAGVEGTDDIELGDAGSHRGGRKGSGFWKQLEGRTTDLPDGRNPGSNSVTVKDRSGGSSSQVPVVTTVHLLLGRRPQEDGSQRRAPFPMPSARPDTKPVPDKNGVVRGDTPPKFHLLEAARRRRERCAGSPETWGP